MPYSSTGQEEKRAAGVQSGDCWYIISASRESREQVNVLGRAESDPAVNQCYLNGKKSVGMKCTLLYNTENYIGVGYHTSLEIVRGVGFSVLYLNSRILSYIELTGPYFHGVAVQLGPRRRSNFSYC